MTNVKKIVITSLVVFCALFTYQISNAQTTAISTKTTPSVVANVQTNSAIDREKEMLEKTINILDKTNTSLTQQWTPISILLSITAGLFALVTLLWAGVFAWGYIIFRKIAMDKKRMAGEMKKLSVEGRKILDDIDVNGKKIFAEFEKEKSKSLPELQNELNEFREKASQAIERFEDKTIGTISGSNQGVYGEATFGNSIYGSGINSGYVVGGSIGMNNRLNNLKVCSKCGNVFKEEVSIGSAFTEIALHSYMFPSSVLCKKCKEEEEKKV